jgi:hypothetical protein
MPCIQLLWNWSPLLELTVFLCPWWIRACGPFPIAFSEGVSEPRCREGDVTPPCPHSPIPPPLSRVGFNGMRLCHNLKDPQTEDQLTGRASIAPLSSQQARSPTSPHKALTGHIYGCAGGCHGCIFRQLQGPGRYVRHRASGPVNPSSPRYMPF